MMKYRGRPIVLIVLISIIIVGGITISMNNKPNDIKIINAVGDLAEEFQSLNDLKQRASAIVEVNVIDSETIIYKDTPFTISTAKVISKAKGNIKEGEEIKLIETGGRYRLPGDNPKETKGQEADYRFFGIPVMQPGEHLFLFVDEFVGPQIKDAYVPLGVFQGKFKVNKDGRVEQQAPKEHKVKDYEEESKEKFKEKMK